MHIVRCLYERFCALIFPPSVHERTLARTETLMPDIASVVTPSGVRVTTCARYRAGSTAHAAVLTLKDRQDTKAVALLAALLGDVLLEMYADAHLWSAQEVLLIPIPLSRARERERGFNQVRVVCNALPDALAARVRTDVLVRTRHTRPQKLLTRRERMANVRTAFALANADALEGAYVFLIDDVITTGATLDSAVRTLEAAGARVSAIALTRA